MLETASALLTLSGPIIMTTSVLRLLKNRPDRDLALPMPIMLLVVLGAQNRGAQGYMSAALVITLLVLLYGCWQQRRTLARWAAVACGGVAVYLQLSALWLART
jgi:hypothetical protein